LEARWARNSTRLPDGKEIPSLLGNGHPGPGFPCGRQPLCGVAHYLYALVCFSRQSSLQICILMSIASAATEPPASQLGGESVIIRGGCVPDNSLTCFNCNSTNPKHVRRKELRVSSGERSVGMQEIHVVVLWHLPPPWYF
jgi:hypothetical protein